MGYLSERASREEAKNGFPGLAKAGTIAPFFIKALVLGAKVCGHPRDVALQRCDKLSRQRPEPPATRLDVTEPLC
jgi:hypothetical protein